MSLRVRPSSGPSRQAVASVQQPPEPCPRCGAMLAVRMVEGNALAVGRLVREVEACRACRRADSILSRKTLALTKVEITADAGDALGALDSAVAALSELDPLGTLADDMARRANAEAADAELVDEICRDCIREGPLPHVVLGRGMRADFLVKTINLRCTRCGLEEWRDIGDGPALDAIRRAQSRPSSEVAKQATPDPAPGERSFSWED